MNGQTQNVDVQNLLDLLYGSDKKYTKKLSDLQSCLAADVSSAVEKLQPHAHEAGSKSSPSLRKASSRCESPDPLTPIVTYESQQQQPEHSQDRFYFVNTPRKRAEVVLDGCLIRKELSTLCNHEDCDVSKFDHDGISYVKVHRPSMLIQNIQNHRSNICSEESGEGICTVADLDYIVNDIRPGHLLPLCQHLMKATRSAFRSMMSETWLKPEFVQSFARMPSRLSVSQRRHVWNVIVFHRYQSMTCPHGHHLPQGAINAALADPQGLTIHMRSGEIYDEVRIPWINTGQIQSWIAACVAVKGDAETRLSIPLGNVATIVDRLSRDLLL